MALPKLYEQVALVRDIDEYGLKRGDVATLVDTVPHPNGGPLGAILEVFNAVGDTLMVVTVPEDEVEPLNANEIWAVRPVVRQAE